MTTNTQLPHRAKTKVGRIRTTGEAYHEEDVGYSALAAAIVMQAVHDYRVARRAAHKKIVYLEGSGERNPAYVMEDVTVFLRSQWYALLCDINPELILKELTGRR